MAYQYKVDHNARKFHFYIGDTLDESLNGLIQNEKGKDTEEELETETEIKIKVTKSNMMKQFFNESNEYFSILHVSEMLKVDRKTLERSLQADALNDKGEKKHPGQFKLETYDVTYYEQEKESKDSRKKEPKWVQSPKQSNLTKIIYYKDLYNFLFNIIDASYEYLGGYSVFHDPEELKLQDAFRRLKTHTEWIKDKPFYVFLEHKNHKSEIKEIVEGIIENKYELHSVASLNDIVRKSKSTYQRLAKCLDSVKIKFNSNKRAMPRYVFEVQSAVKEEQNEKITEQLSQVLSIIAKNKIAIIPKKLKVNEYIEQRFFRDPIDYLSLYTNGYKGKPDGYYKADDELLYYAVESENTEVNGIKIKDIIPEPQLKLLDIEKN